jgi:quercetin dioxygenase-like cupin family protein
MTLRAESNVVQPHEGLSLDLGYTRLRVLLSGEETDGAFALTEQPLEAGALAGPLHTHANEDGFIYVLLGRIGAQVGDDTVEVSQGGVILVRRGVKHTFWNPTAQDAAVLEFFSPAGLERWFHELAQLVAAKEPDIHAILESARRHGTELDLDSLPGLLERHEVHMPGL